MKRILFVSLLAFLICIVAVPSHARKFYGHIELQGTDITGVNGIDADTITINDTATADTVAVKMRLNMNDEEIKNVDWSNSDTDGLRADLLDGQNSDSLYHVFEADTIIPNDTTVIPMTVQIDSRAAQSAIRIISREDTETVYVSADTQGIDLHEQALRNVAWDSGLTDDGAGSNLDADLLDGRQSGNDTGDIPIANGGTVTGLYADTATLADTATASITADTATDAFRADTATDSFRSDTATNAFIADTSANANQVSGEDLAKLIERDRIDVEDNGSLINDADTLNFGDTLTVSCSNNTCTIDATGTGGGGGGGSASTSFNDTGYLQPDGLVISDATGKDESVSVAINGAVDVSATSGDTNHQVIEIDAGETADLTESGCNGLVKGSLTSNAWYKGYVLADDDGANPPCMAFVQEGNTLTPADLPSGYELSRNMAEPGKTWWVRTDGSSNIIDFVLTSDGWYSWPSNRGELLNGGTAGSDQTVDISTQVPPTTVNLNINGSVRDDGAASLVWSFNRSTLSSENDGEIWGRSFGDYDNISGQLTQVTGQDFHYYTNDNLDRFRVLHVGSFKAVN